MSGSTHSELLVKPGEGTPVGEITIKVHMDAMSGDFGLAEQELSDGELIPPHVHAREDQAVYVIDGELEFEVDGEGGTRFTAPKGSYVIKPRGREHCFWNNSGKPARYIELSGRGGFEDFMLDTESGNPVDIARAQVAYAITFNTQRIPKLMKENGLTRVSGMEGLPSLKDALKKMGFSRD